jgi:hypothetical protein
MPRYSTDSKLLEKYIRPLILELKKPPQPGPPDIKDNSADNSLPVIIEEPTYLGRVGVTVIWNGWDKLSGELRGRVILDAYKAALGEAEALKIGVAMGFTWEQYSRIQSQAG